MQIRKTIHEYFFFEADVKSGSDRSFGLVFAAVFAIIAGIPVLSGRDIRWWTVAVAVTFLAVALKAPKILSPLNRIWFRFGLILHKLVNPIALGLMFFIVFCPFALILRVLGKRPLALKFNRDASTYWIPRTPPAPTSGSMTQQF